MRQMLNDRRMFRRNLALNPRISTGTTVGITEFWGSDIGVDVVPSDGPQHATCGGLGLAA